MKNDLCVTIAAPLLLFGVDAVGRGATIHVPADHRTIQGGIDAAVDGDTVLVTPGTYVENIDFNGKAITVKSVDGPSTTIIDGHEAGPVVVFLSGEGNDSVLEGFTITNGSGMIVPTFSKHRAGGGILTVNSSPTIRGNAVRGNTITGPQAGVGAGIACYGPSSPLVIGNDVHGNRALPVGAGSAGGGVAICHGCTAIVRDNVIHHNETNTVGAHCGGGVWCVSSAPVISHNVIHGNVSYGGGGIGCSSGSTARITDNVIFGNTAAWGAGVDVNLSSQVWSFENNTVAANTATEGGGGIKVAFTSSVKILNSIVWGNIAPIGAQLAALDDSSLVIGDSDVQGELSDAYVEPDATLVWGAGMISADPRFVDPGGGDYALAFDSPVIDEGRSASLGSGVDLAGFPRVLDGDLDQRPAIDLGAYEFGNVHLDITGPPTPGGTLTVEIDGESGLEAYLLVGTGPGEAVLWPYGGLLIDVTSPFLQVPMGTIPVSFSETLPAALPTPLTVHVQAVGLALSAGNTSNAVELTIE